MGMQSRSMTGTLGGAVALALSMAAASTSLPVAAQTVSPAPSDTVQIATGRGRLVTLSAPMTDVFIANDAIADVSVRSPRQLYIFGKGTGETTLYATGKNGRVVYAATLRVGNNFDTIGRMLSLAMPDARITATTMSGMVLLTGDVASPQDAAEAERLVTALVGDTVKVLSRLKTATPLQVNLQVRFAEVSRSFAKNVGVNFKTLDRTGGFQFGIGAGRDAGTLTSSAREFSRGEQHTTLGLAGSLLGLDLLSAIDLGETTGQVTTLANPNLTAMSGETGTFLAGGEVPIPIAQALGTVSVEYKQYGVSLAYTPIVLSDGRISLRVRPEVSQLDYSAAVTVGSTRVPALTTRRAETTVELGSGQSFMIGGLLQNSHNNNIEKAPFLGDIPILGALFRSNSFQRNETELVIIITPYLVKPMNASQAALPTDGYRAPSDAERILMGQIGSGSPADRRPVPTMAPPQFVPPAGGSAALPAQPAAPVTDQPRQQADRPRKGKAIAAMPGFSSH